MTPKNHGKKASWPRYLALACILMALCGTLVGSHSLVAAQAGEPLPLAALVPPGRMRVSQQLIAPKSGQVAVGEVLTIRITIRNVGVVPLGYLHIRDQYPRDGWEYVSSSPPALEDVGGYYSWHGVPLPSKGLQPGASVSVEITFRVVAAYPNMVNHAFVSGWTTNNQEVPPTYAQLPIRIIARDLYCGRSWADYAPVGMPDFSQLQEGWQKNQGQQWSYAGPVALANVLWWLDSGRETGSARPPAQQDSYALVSAYGDWDDHDPRNVPPLVQDLAIRADTDGVISGQDRIGTAINDLYDGTLSLLAEKGLSESYDVQLMAAPSITALQETTWQCDGLVLLLGIWETQQNTWKRLGGHYASVACVNRWTETNPLIQLADPRWDRAEEGRPGQYYPGLDHNHPTLPPDAVHNDAAYVSWDLYSLGAATAPGGSTALKGYELETREINGLLGQNVPASLSSYQAQRHLNGPIQVVIEYALRIRDTSQPSLCPQPPITPVPTPTATPMLQERTVTLQQGVDGYTGMVDTYLSLWSPTTNYGRSGSLQVRSEGYMRPLLKFDLTQIPATATILEATLALQTASGGWYEQDLSVFQVLVPWDAQQATWTKANASTNWGGAGCDKTGVDHAALPEAMTLAIAGSASEFDMTDLVQSWVRHPENNHGLLIQGQGSIAVQHSLIAAEHWYAAQRPKLTIRYGMSIE